MRFLSECPDWVRLRWEENHLNARLDLMESLDQGLLGDHNAPSGWAGEVNEGNPDSDEIVWAA